MANNSLLFANLPVTRPCERCSGVDRVLQERGYYCPCCKSVLKTGEMAQMQAERRAAEMGLTLDEYTEHCRTLVRDFKDEPPGEAEKEHVVAVARQLAAEWTPACEHDTENPWERDWHPGRGIPHPRE